MFIEHFSLNVFAITADFTRYTNCQLVLFQKFRNFGDKCGKLQASAYIGFILTELHGQRLNVMPTAFNKFLICVCFLNGCNILSLQVLRYRHFLCHLVRHVQYDRRNYRHFRHKGSTVSAFSENYLKFSTFINRAYSYRLQDPLLTDAVCQFRKARLVKMLAWVVTARLNVCQCYHTDVLFFY